MINKKTFTNADLVGDNFQLEYTHNLNTTSVIPALFDNTGRQVNTADLFQKGTISGSNLPNVCNLTLNNEIAGTWELLLEYQSTAETSSGRRAFELDPETDPSTDMRLIIGKADTPSKNLPLSNFITWLQGKLDFLKTASNLNDVQDKATSRNNLGVYSKTEIDSALSNVPVLYQTSSGAVLGVSNTAVYDPTANYHPATKKYADENGGGRIISGVEHLGDWSGLGATKTVTIGATLANNSYKVFGELFEATGKLGFYVVKSKGTTSFDISIKSDSDTGTDFYLYWEIKTF
jgi:hypothetical protein